MRSNFTHFRLLSLSILLTVVLSSCGQSKPTNSFYLSYDSNGLITSALVADQTPINQADSYQPGQKLLATSWGQDAPYNSQLPLIGSESTPVGCVNTALAQLMSFHKNTVSTKGKIKGALNEQVAWADFDQSINWDLIEGGDGKLRALELGTLFRNLVIANKTTIRTSSQGGSGTTVFNALRTMTLNLGFANSIQSISKQATETNLELTQKLVEEINAKRPVLLSTTGTLNHLLIIDGYKIQDDEYLFHLNLGWEGQHDGFYSLDRVFEVHQEFTRDNQRYRRTLTAEEFEFIFNIMPCRVNCFSTLEENDSITDQSISGNFDNYLDEDLFGPFPASTNFEVIKNSIARAPYYITILDKGLQPVTENISSFRFSTEDSFYIRVSSKSAFTTSYYPASSSYSLAISAELAPSMKSQLPQDFSFNLSHSAVNITSDQAVRIQAFPYLPDDIRFEIIGTDMPLDSLKLRNNLIEINAEKVSSNFIGKVRVRALNNDQLVDEREFTLVNLRDGIQLEKDQILSGILSKEKPTSFKTVLKGNCKISGDRGFSNQGFYLSTDINEPSDNAFSSSYPAGIYSIHASLSNGLSSYSFSEENSRFTISVICDDEVAELDELRSLF